MTTTNQQWESPPDCTWLRDASQPAFYWAQEWRAKPAEAGAAGRGYSCRSMIGATRSAIRWGKTTQRRGDRVALSMLATSVHIITPAHTEPHNRCAITIIFQKKGKRRRRRKKKSLLVFPLSGRSLLPLTYPLRRQAKVATSSWLRRAEGFSATSASGSGITKRHIQPAARTQPMRWGVLVSEQWWRPLNE